jgi:hypothetical protein
VQACEVAVPVQARALWDAYADAVCQRGGARPTRVAPSDPTRLRGGVSETAFSRVRRSESSRPPCPGRWFGVHRALPGSQVSTQRRRFILAPKHAHSLQLRHDRVDEIGKRVREECR